MTLEGFLNEKLLCENGKYLLGYKNGELILRDAGTKKILQKHRINAYFRSVGIIGRLLRYEPRTAVAISSDEFIISCHGKIIQYSTGDNSIRTEHVYRNGMSNPLTFCIRYEANGTIADLLYGEYTQNDNRQSVSVYRRRDDHWEEIYTFPEKTIRHIHRICNDRYRNLYLILTGDENSESGIWEADYDFTQVKPVVIGKQQYRACVAFCTEQGLYYITDTPFEVNHVYRLSEDRKIEPIHEISGPCIFGIEKGNNLYFATSVEGDSSKSKIEFLLSNRPGKGVKDRYSHLYKLDKDGKLEEIIKMKKDIWPMALFEFGNMKFPAVESDRVFVCPQSLGCKYGTYLVRE